MQSFILEQIVIFFFFFEKKKTETPISDTYPEQKPQYINVLLEQINHLRQKNKNKLASLKDGWKTRKIF